MSTLRMSRVVRLLAVAAFLSASATYVLAGSASGEQSLSEMRARLSKIQSELDSTTSEVEAAHARREELASRMAVLREDLGKLRKENQRLRDEAVKRAASLYMEGGTGMVEALLSASDFADLSDNAEILSRVSLGDTDIFVRLARSEKRVADVVREMNADRAELKAVEEDLQQKVDRLQAQFDSLSGDVKKEMEKMGVPASLASNAPAARGGMYCPVAGPTSFVNSWGAPRSGGRAHQGVDMMGARGTPQVAIVSGTITYAGYSSLGGNVQYLSGDDGNLYVYIHQQSHVVSSGRVQAGQVISLLGDTGNARGMPHLHFEVHPGGGAAVNPYPLVASLCR